MSVSKYPFALVSIWTHLRVPTKIICLPSDLTNLPTCVYLFWKTVSRSPNRRSHFWQSSENRLRHCHDPNARDQALFTRDLLWLPLAIMCSCPFVKSEVPLLNFLWLIIVLISAGKYKLQNIWVDAQLVSCQTEKRKHISVHVLYRSIFARIRSFLPAYISHHSHFGGITRYNLSIFPTKTTNGASKTTTGGSGPIITEAIYLVYPIGFHLGCPKVWQPCLWHGQTNSWCP